MKRLHGGLGLRAKEKEDRLDSLNYGKIVRM